VLLSRRNWLALGVLALSCRDGRRKAGGPAKRLVSISPSTTEAIFALGAGNRLVGRSRYCDYPPEVRGVPAVGGFVDPSFEAVIALKPDLVVGVQGPGLRDFAERLDARGIDTYFPPTQSIREINAMLVALGKLLGDEQAGQRVVDRITSQTATVAAAIVNRRRPRALVVFGLRPIVVAGPGSFPDEMLRLAGGENVVRTERTRFPTLGIERVLALDPDVIVDTTGVAMREEVSVSRDLPGWSEVRAARDNHIIRVSDDRVLRPGPRVGEGLTVLAKALHPGVALP